MLRRSVDEGKMMTQAAAQAEHERDSETTTIYTAYELDFMLELRSTDNGRITREQMGLRRAPEEALDFVTAAVTSGLRARDKVQRSAEGQWLLGEEAQVIASTLTSADRWLALALSEGEAMRMAFVVVADQAVLMLTQDELDSFVISALPDPSHVPESVADVAAAFLAEGNQRTVSMRRTDISAPEEQTPMMFHAESDGSWRSGHMPLDDQGVLSVSPITAEQLAPSVRSLWEDGVSQAPAS